LSTGTWYHVAVTRASGSTTLYLDGVSKAASSSTPVSPAGKKKGIGADAQNSGSFFNGWIDDVAVYNAALSDVQVLAHATAGINDRNNTNAVRPHWHYTYDAMGNELTQTDPKGNVTTWAYTYADDALNALMTGKSRTLPGGQQEKWTF